MRTISPRSDRRTRTRGRVKHRPSSQRRSKFREYTVPSGTKLSRGTRYIRSGSDSSRLNDPVDATLVDAVLGRRHRTAAGGQHAQGRGDHRGIIRQRARAARVSAWHFNRSRWPDATPSYPLSTGMHHTAAATKGDDAKKIGIPAVGGAILGAILGGKKGALIGNGPSAGGAGAVVVLNDLRPGGALRPWAPSSPSRYERAIEHSSFPFDK